MNYWTAHLRTSLLITMIFPLLTSSITASNSINNQPQPRLLTAGKSHLPGGKLKSQPTTPTNLVVDNDNVIMDNFLGVNAVYHGFAYFKENPGLPSMGDDDRQAEFRRIKSMRLKIARTWYRANWACKSSIYDEYNWDSAKMKAFYLWLDKMKALNVDIALQAGWSFPNDTFYGRNVPDSTRDIDRYADWVNESLQQMIKIRGYTNIKYLVLFTEPLNHSSGKTASPISNLPQYYAKVCTAIDQKLKQSGLRTLVKLVGPNSGSTDTAAYVGWSVNNLNNVIDIYSWHSYNGKTFGTNPPQEYDGWRKIVEAGKEKVAKTNKPFWIDEYGANRPDETVRFKPDYGNYLAQCVAAFINSGAQSSFLWILFDQKYEGNFSNNDSFYNGVQRWGLVKSPHDNVSGPLEPRPAWYAFNLMSRYLGGGPNTKVYKTESADSLYVVSTQSAKGLTVMVVNASHTSRKFNLTFTKSINQNLKRYLYDPQKVKISALLDQIALSNVINNVQNSFSGNLPSRGFSIYTSAE